MRDDLIFTSERRRFCSMWNIGGQTAECRGWCHILVGTFSTKLVSSCGSKTHLGALPCVSVCDVWDVTGAIRLACNVC